MANATCMYVRMYVRNKPNTAVPPSVVRTVVQLAVVPYIYLQPHLQSHQVLPFRHFELYRYTHTT